MQEIELPNTNILRNEVGDLMLLIKYLNNSAPNAYIEYDGGEDMYLYKGDIKYDVSHIHEKIRNDLYNKDTILVVELYNNSVATEYKTPIKKLPRVQTQNQPVEQEQ